MHNYMSLCLHNNNFHNHVAKVYDHTSSSSHFSVLLTDDPSTRLMALSWMSTDFNSQNCGHTILLVVIVAHATEHAVSERTLELQLGSQDTDLAR